MYSYDYFQFRSYKQAEDVLSNEESLIKINTVKCYKPTNSYTM